MASQAVTRKRGLRRSKLVAKGGTWETISANASAADIIHMSLSRAFRRRGGLRRSKPRAAHWRKWTGRARKPGSVSAIDAPGTADELARVLVGRPHLVYCAKVKSPEDILKLDRTVSRLEADIGIPRAQPRSAP